MNRLSPGKLESLRAPCLPAGRLGISAHWIISQPILLWLGGRAANAVGCRLTALTGYLGSSPSSAKDVVGDGRIKRRGDMTRESRLGDPGSYLGGKSRLNGEPGCSAGDVTRPLVWNLVAELQRDTGRKTRRSHTPILTVVGVGPTFMWPVTFYERGI